MKIFTLEEAERLAEQIKHEGAQWVRAQDFGPYVNIITGEWKTYYGVIFEFEKYGKQYCAESIEDFRKIVKTT